MHVTVSCPACRKPLKVAEESVGKRMRCPGCKEVFTCPKEAETPMVPTVAEELTVDPEELIGQEVGQKLEKLAEVPNVDDLGELVVAFANATGGNILVGVDPESNVVGCDFNELKAVFA